MPRSKFFLYFLAGSVLFILFGLFSYLVHENVFTGLDFITTVRLQDRIPRRVDGFFSWFSFFGKFEFMIVVLGILLITLRKIIGGLVAFFLFGFFLPDHDRISHDRVSERLFCKANSQCLF